MVDAWGVSPQDEEALIAEYMPLVRMIAGRWVQTHRAADIDDVISDGYLSLVLAVRSHKASELPLEAWVKWKVNRGLVDGVRARLGRQLYTVVDPDPLLVQAAQEIRFPTRSFDEAMEDQSGTQLLLMEMLAEVVPGDLTVFERVDARRDLLAAAEGLDARTRRMMGCYFELDRTLLEIAQAEGCTEGRVSQVLSRGLRRMGHAYGAGDVRPRLSNRRGASRSTATHPTA